MPLYPLASPHPRLSSPQPTATRMQTYTMMDKNSVIHNGETEEEKKKRTPSRCRTILLEFEIILINNTEGIIIQHRMCGKCCSEIEGLGGNFVLASILGSTHSPKKFTLWISASSFHALRDHTRQPWALALLNCAGLTAWDSTHNERWKSMRL